MMIRPAAVALMMLCLPVACPGDAAPRAGLRISSPFGLRVDPLGEGLRMHDGIDLPVPAGAPIRAAAAGRVRSAGWHGGYGELIEIAHADGSRTRYGHLSRIFVGPGQAVAQGEVIGAAGSTGRSTGSHLHFEYWTGGVPVDPLPYLGAAPARTAPRAEAAFPAAPIAPQAAYLSAFARGRDTTAAPPGLPDGTAATRGAAR